MSYGCSRDPSRLVCFACDGDPLILRALGALQKHFVNYESGSVQYRGRTPLGVARPCGPACNVPLWPSVRITPFSLRGGLLWQARRYGASHPIYIVLFEPPSGLLWVRFLNGGEYLQVFAERLLYRALDKEHAP